MDGFDTSIFIKSGATEPLLVDTDEEYELLGVFIFTIVFLFNKKPQIR